MITMNTRKSTDICYAIGHPTQPEWRLHTYERMGRQIVFKWTTKIGEALVFSSKEKAEIFMANYLSNTTVIIVSIY